MANYVGLVAVVVIVIFIIGVLFGVCMIVAAGIRASDKVTMQRRGRELVLRDVPASPAARGIQRLVGVGQRVGPERIDR